MAGIISGEVGGENHRCLSSLRRSVCSREKTKTGDRSLESADVRDKQRGRSRGATEWELSGRELGVDCVLSF